MNDDGEANVSIHTDASLREKLDPNLDGGYWAASPIGARAAARRFGERSFNDLAAGPPVTLIFPLSSLVVASDVLSPKGPDRGSK